ncbi:hypothetical protein KYX80_05775, partial [Enterococcus lactis]|nr:hypothetical protein [Enterococcus lactis]
MFVEYCDLWLRSRHENTVYQEVVSLPFHYKPPGVISKNSSSYFMNIVLLIRRLQRKIVYSK